MLVSRLRSVSLIVGVAVGTTIIACSDTKKGNPGVDARPVDGQQQLDSPSSSLTGLGQKCGAGVAACSANAPDCIALGLSSTMQSTTYCTPHWLDDGSGTTNGSAQLTTTVPEPDATKCTGAFTGTAGTPLCGVILATTPADNPLMANKHCAGIQLGCIVGCPSATPTCPPSMTCNTTVHICFPT